MHPMRTAAITACAVAALAVSLPGCAAAQPPGFPDLSGLTDVTSTHPLNNPRGQPGFAFAIPDGYACSGGGSSVSCDGQMPGLAGIPKVASRVGPCDVGEAMADSTWVRLQHFMAECRSAVNGNILNPGQKVSQGSATCGVLPGNVTACTNSAHGFVIQPQGSWSF